MGVSYKKGTFVMPAANGDLQVTDVGFRPKVIILWGINSTGETFIEHYSLCFGFVDDNFNQACSTSMSEDNGTTSDTYSNANAVCCYNLCNPTTGASIGLATFSGMLANGFTLSWVKGDANQYVVHYIAIGGTDITNYIVGTQTITSSTTGNQAYTGVGFQPDFVLTTSWGRSTSISTTSATTEAHAGLGISAFASPTKRWAISTVSEDGVGTSDTWRYQSNTKCFTALQNSSGAVEAVADLVSMDSDGWTWNFTTNLGNIPAHDYQYLAIKGGVWDVGDHQAPAANSTVTTNTTVGSGNVLKGVFIANYGGATASEDTAGVTSNLLNIGGADAAANQGMITYCDLDNQANMVIAQRQNNDNLVYMMVSNATATSSTVISVGTVAVFGTNSFAVTYTNSDGNARAVKYFAVSEAAAGAAVPQAFGDTNLKFLKQSGGQGTIFG